LPQQLEHVNIKTLTVNAGVEALDVISLVLRMVGAI